MPEVIVTESDCQVNSDFDNLTVERIRKNVCIGLETSVFEKDKNFCLLHDPKTDKDEAEDFTKLVNSRIEAQNYNFEGVFFPKDFILEGKTFNDVFDCSNARFNGKATFNQITFKKDAVFNDAIFHNEANFTFSRFEGEAIFTRTVFENRVDFSFAVFDENTRAIFWNSDFQGLLSFRFAVVKGQIFLYGNNEKRLFSADEFRLSLREIKIAEPENLVIQSATLFANWFIGADLKKIRFVDVEWMRTNNSFWSRNLLAEIDAAKKRKIENPVPLLKIAYSGLAENAHANDRFGDASIFRRMACEAERLEREDRVKKWRNTKLTRSNFANKFWEKSRNFPYDLTHFIYRWSSNYGESWSWAALILLVIILVIFPLIYAQTNFYVCPVENSVSNCETRTLYKDEAVRQSLATGALQSVETRKANSPYSETFTIFEKIIVPLQAALLALAIRRKFMR